MIRYALSCDRGHGFESWFKSASAYDKQAARGLIGCPVCGSTKVGKAIMAPGVARSAPREVVAPQPPAPAPAPEPRVPVAMLSAKERELRAKLKELRDHVVKNADYVGQKFPEEARKMHYGEVEHRSIYGEASSADRRRRAHRGRHRAPPAADPARRAQLILRNHCAQISSTARRSESAQPGFRPSAAMCMNAQRASG